MAVPGLTRVRTVLFVFTLVFGAAACAALSFENRATRPSDGNVVAMFLAANNTDISYAQVALSTGHASASPVVAFATRMLNDHAGLNQSATEVVAQTKISVADNVASLDLRDESAAKRDTLRELHGAQFDSAYMANEVRYHTKLLHLLDTVLIPAVRNPDFRLLLTNVRPAVAAHLEHAQRVQAGLGK